MHITYMNYQPAKRQPSLSPRRRVSQSVFAVLLFLVLALLARAFLGAFEICPKTLAVFPNALVVLARATRSGLLFSRLLLEGIGALFQRLLNGKIPGTRRVVLHVEASDAGTCQGIAHFALLEAGAVQLQTTRTDTVAGLFARSQRSPGSIRASTGKRTRVADQNGSNRQGSSSFRSALLYRVFTI